MGSDVYAVKTSSSAALSSRSTCASQRKGGGTVTQTLSASRDILPPSAPSEEN